MRKIYSLIAFLVCILNINAQTKVDTIIKNSAYTSYFCKAIKQPLYVSYILYKGGGDCDRTKFRFKNDTKLKTATLKDYASTGYDQGHLANAEDFANDCVKDELTFRFYNCLPQTANLNRGIWKKWETEIRKESQIDSLFILTGGTFKIKSVIGKGVWVPDHCWKVVQSVKTNRIKHVLYFTNTNKATCSEITLAKLEEIIGYKLPIIK
jgi:endonuclease G